MDASTSFDKSEANITARDLYKGPLRLDVAKDNFSVEIPEGWIAGIDRDGLYGFEPIHRSDGFIYSAVLPQRINITKRLMATRLDLDYINLKPASELFINNNLISSEFTVLDSRTCKYAYVVCAEIINHKTLAFVALSSGEVGYYLKSTVLGIANSIKRIELTYFTKDTQAESRI